MSGAQHRRRLWRAAVRRQPAQPFPPPTTRIDTLISDIDWIADALCSAPDCRRPALRAAALRRTLLGYAAELAAAGMPGTADLVTGLVGQIDETSARRPRESRPGSASDARDGSIQAVV